jgi:hypothetical protein
MIAQFGADAQRETCAALPRFATCGAVRHRLLVRGHLPTATPFIRSTCEVGLG